jgi:hypothetical protein
MLASRAEAARRYALIVGVNEATRDDPRLRFAERDALRIADILKRLGRFQPDDMVIATESSAEDMRRALDSFDQRIRADGGDSLFFVFYSGHADGDALKMGKSRLPLLELRDRISSSPASVRVLVLDACRSGVLTRTKGGHRAPAFEVPDERALGAEGVAILASSAAGEDAQESDELGASFFTHYFASALLGAADRDGDGHVTLAESFAYASERTLAATHATMVGPQHPTYRMELHGRDDLVLTNVSDTAERELGRLEFREPGQYLVQRRGDSEPVVAEVLLEEGRARPLALAPGVYRVTRRAADHLLEGDLRVSAGAATVVASEDMQRVEFARVVRKGGTDIESSLSAWALGGVRGSVLESGTNVAGTFGTRLDRPELSYEVRLGYAEGVTQEKLRIDTRELALSAVAFKPVDVGPISMGAGLQGGGTWITQIKSDPLNPRADQFAVFAGPLGMVELPIGRMYVRLEAGVPVYLVRAQRNDGSTAREVHVTFSTGLGLGVYL